MPKVRAHVWVWMNYHGKPPKGMHVHHKDENKSNNSIDNLTILSPRDHLIHHLKVNPDKLRKLKENCANIRDLTKAWHASEEGKAWHRLHALKENFGNWEAWEYTCDFCNKKFMSKKRNRVRFCHNNCKSASRRKMIRDGLLPKPSY